MSAWTDGECPPGDPTTVGERIQQILDWIAEDLTWATHEAHPTLHDVLMECQAEAIRVRDQITVYEPVNAQRLFDAWRQAQTAHDLPREDPGGKETEWRGVKETLEQIQD